MASMASLLYLRFWAMTNLHQFIRRHFLRDFGVSLPAIQIRQGSKVPQLVTLDIGAIVLGEEVYIDPVAPHLRHNVRSMQDIRMSSLEDPAACPGSYSRYRQCSTRCYTGADGYPAVRLSALRI